MCFFRPQQPQGQYSEPVQHAAMKQPDSAAVRTATQRRVMGKVKSKTPTILTSGQGVTEFAETQKKTLLGQ